mgnify:CR=1 FL=1
MPFNVLVAIGLCRAEDLGLRLGGHDVFLRFGFVRGGLGLTWYDLGGYSGILAQSTIVMYGDRVVPIARIN